MKHADEDSEARERASRLGGSLAAGCADPGTPGAVRLAGLHLSLESAGDPAFQRREWRVQRAGCALLGGWLAAAVLGLTGPGPCSTRERHGPESAVAYDGVVHQDAPTHWHVTAPKGIETLTVEDAEAMELGELRPSASQQARPDGARVLEFRGGAPRTLELEVVPRRVGWSRARLQVGGGTPLELQQLVLP